MSIHFDGAGMNAEHLAAKQFNGTLTSVLDEQYADIDLHIRGKSVSVKDQLESSAKYGSIQIELSMTNTRNDDSRPGCFYNCKADYYFWRVSLNDDDYWCVIETSVMRDYVEQNKQSLRTWQTRHYTEQKNRNYGRTFDRASGVNIPLQSLVKLGKCIAVKEV